MRRRNGIDSTIAPQLVCPEPQSMESDRNSLSGTPAAPRTFDA
jgi:hypothetical protein